MTPKQVKAARRAVGLTAAEAAHMVGLANFQAWQRYETAAGVNARAIPEPTLRLFAWQVAHLPRLLEAARISLRSGNLNGGLEVASILATEARIVDPNVLCAALVLNDHPSAVESLGKPVLSLLLECGSPRPRSAGANAIILAGVIRELRVLSTQTGRWYRPRVDRLLAAADAIKQPDARLSRLFLDAAAIVCRRLDAASGPTKKVRA